MHLYIVLNNGETINKFVTRVEFVGNALRFYEIHSQENPYAEDVGPTYVYMENVRSFSVSDH